MITNLILAWGQIGTTLRGLGHVKSPDHAPTQYWKFLISLLPTYPSQTGVSGGSNLLVRPGGINVLVVEEFMLVEDYFAP